MLYTTVFRRSRTPWSVPVVIADKKDGSKRFCVELRKLNQMTEKNAFPLPVQLHFGFAGEGNILNFH